MTSFDKDDASGLPPDIGQPTADASTEQTSPVVVQEPVITPAPEAGAEIAFDEIPLAESSNVKQHFGIDKKDTLKTGRPEVSDQFDTIAFPSANAKTTAHNLNHPAASKDDPDSIVWRNLVEQGELPRVTRDVYGETLQRVGSEFLQYLATQNGNVGFSSPKFAEQGVAKLTGENAMVRMRALLGAGGLVTVPLWHSGFHITLKTPKDSALLELRERTEQARIQLGRMTFGLIFSSTSGFIVESIVDMILDHVYNTTLKDSSELRKKISALDLPILVWGMACAIWPNGFQYLRAITTKEGIESKEFVSGMIDVPKLMWVDQNAFTEQQRAHMSNRQPGQVTNEALDAYRKQFVSTEGRTININESGSVQLKMRVPNLEDYVKFTHNWVDSLVNAVERTFTGDRDDLVGRNTSIQNHANLSRMRQYGHWVEGVIIEGESYTSEQDVAEALEILTDLDNAKKVYFDSIDKFIADSTVALIAIPETSGKETSMPRFPHLLPIDAVSTFFTLLMRRTSRILPQETN